MGRPRTVYRGKRKYSWIITLAVFLLVILLILAVWLFYDLQRYVVYDKDGVRLVLPSQRTDTLPPDADAPQGAARPAGPVEVELVVDPADYSNVTTGAGQDLAPLHARYYAFADINERSMDFEHRGLGEYNALILELKAADGFLCYRSGLALTDSYAVNGTLDLGAALETLRAVNPEVWLVARISAPLDTAMATRNVPAALKKTDGTVYQEDGQAWLDPYSDTTRDYLGALLRELKALGFDEVLLGGYTCPAGERVQFSKAMTVPPTARDALVSFGLWLREEADALGLKLSVVLEPEAFSEDESDPMGQDAALFLRIFDRVAFDTAAVSADDALAQLSSAAGDAETRLLPIVAEARESGSFAVK